MRYLLSLVSCCSVIGAVVSVAACGSSSGSDATGEPDAGSDVALADGSSSGLHDGAPLAEAGSDAEADSDAQGDSDTYPAMHPPLPQLTNKDGAILTNPKIVTVTFEGDTNGPSYAAFAGAMSGTTWWQKTLLPYGISESTSSSAVVLPDALAGMTTDYGAFKTYLADQIASGALPTADDQTLYVVYASPTMVVTIGSGSSILASCDELETINSEFDAPVAATADAGADGGDGGAPATVRAALAVVFDCGGLKAVQLAASLVIADVTTDPRTSGNGYVLDTDSAWESVFAQPFPGELTEAADPCVYVPAWDEGGYSLTRVYSNSAATLSQNPCQPATGVYFAAAPETMTVPTGPADAGAVDQGIVQVHPGSSTAVVLHFFSEAALAYPATLSVGITTESPTRASALSPIEDGVTATLSAPTAQNGDDITLTITASASATGGSIPFVIRSTTEENSVFNDWAVTLLVQ
jgi:hypothetical protein